MEHKPIKEIQLETAKILLESGAVQIRPNSPFTYSSGIKSPIYCDNRLILSHHAQRNSIKNYFIEHIKELSKELGIKYDAICGVATSGIPWAAIIADELALPLVYARSKAKEHGQGRAVEGKLEKGQRVLMIEDLITTGGSSLAAIQNLRDAGGIVEECLAITTYELETAAQGFAQNKCRLITLTNFSTLIETAIQMRHITPKERDIVFSWNKDTENWAQIHGFG